MASWASIAKRNLPATTTTTTTQQSQSQQSHTLHKPSTTSAAASASASGGRVAPPIIFSEADRIAEINRNTYATSAKEIAREDETNCRPEFWVVPRPDGMVSHSPFITDEARLQMEWDVYYKNREYSNELHKARMMAWREKNNWHFPPMKKEISEFEKGLGFYTKPGEYGEGMIVAYVTPYRTTRDISCDHICELMWGMIHSRSEELVKCDTVGAFNALFEQVVKLEIPMWRKNCGGGIQTIHSSKILWLFSQRANVFPGRRRHGTPRWTNSAYSIPSERDPNYTANMVFTHVPKGGRDDAGICVVEKLKENGDNAKIRWLLNAKQLREMERVELYPEYNPFAHDHDNDFDSDFDW
jgi:hypothetical protein